MDSTRQAQLRHSNTDGADLILVGELSAVTGRSSATCQGASGSVAIGAGSSAGREIRIGFNLDERSCGRVALGSWTAHERSCVLEPWYLDVRDRAAQWLAEDSALLRASNSVEIFMERSSRVLALARILSDVSVEACTIDVVQAGLAAINAAAQRLLILMIAEGRTANLLSFTQRMQLVGDVSPALAEAAWAQIRADALRNFTQARATFDAASREPRERRLLHRRLATAFSQAEAMSVEVPLTRACLEALCPR